MANLVPQKTALVLIDLQKGIVGRELSPYTGEEIVKGARELSNRFRSAGATVVWVTVSFSPDGADALRQPVDRPMAAPPGGFPPDFSELADGLAAPGDIHIVKRQWGAFHQTELDLQLRRRGIETVVLGGIATNMGVESTARQAWEHGYALILPEDLSTTFSREMQDFAFQTIFPRIGRVTATKTLVF
ncbi:MAG: hydrolase [Leptospirillia bacterium]